MGTRSEVQETKYVEIRAYTYIYMHIHAHTTLVGICLYIYNFLIHTYTCTYMHIRSGKLYMHGTGSLIFLHLYCTYIARICSYSLQYRHVFARMTDYMEINATNNFPYKNTYKLRTYVQIWQNIRAYTYTIYVQYTVK